MREKLAPLEGKRCHFRARYTQTGNEVLTNRVTLLLTNVRNQQGHLLADHAWAVMPPSFLGRGIAPGDDIEFSALVCRYRRGGDDGEDFGLKTLLGIHTIGAAAAIRQRNQGGGGLPVPRVNPTANVAIARADRPGRVEPQKNIVTRTIPVDPEAHWDMPGFQPTSIAQANVWLSKAQLERRTLLEHFPQNEPGVHKPPHVIKRLTLLRDRIRELNIIASTTSDRTAFRETALRLGLDKADDAHLLAATYEIARDLARKLQAALQVHGSLLFTEEEQAILDTARRRVAERGLHSDHTTDRGGGEPVPRATA